MTLEDVRARLTSLLAAARASGQLDFDALFEAAYDVGRLGERDSAELAAAVVLLRQATEHECFEKEAAEAVYDLRNRAGSYDEYVGHYGLSEVLPLRSGIAFLKELVPARLATEEMDDMIEEVDDVLARSRGDAVDFPDALPAGVAESHWWWRYDTTGAEDDARRRRRGEGR